MKTILLTTITLLYTLIFFTGCTANLTDPEIEFSPPKYVEQMPAREDQKDFVSSGSIFGQGDNPLFSDRKAMHVNDIVTVVISETAKSSNVGSKSLSKTDASALGGGLFSSAGTGINGSTQNQINNLNGFSNIGFNANSTSSFNGSGSAIKDASFTTTISARIVKVLKNGNYFISGKREILIDDQKQIVQLSGVIRPYDIDQFNNINSSSISDAKILYKTEGDMDRATQQGWGTKIVQAIWPF
ncbi:MAG: flagellar basal body L-ring protein FlgH [Sulfurimonas sp.]